MLRGDGAAATCTFPFITAVVAAAAILLCCRAARGGEGAGSAEGGEKPYAGRWYGDDVYFGLHYDLHAE